MTSNPGFKDHFSAHAASYARARPTYPPALFSWVAGIAPSRERAWDAGTGSGQAAVALAAHFAEVVATDPSAAQVRSAVPHGRVRYGVARAEASALARASCDLVTVAQALHWMDLDAFWAEARRVLRPDGVLAAWSYGDVGVSPEVDAAMAPMRARVAPYWPPERALVDAGYRTIAFPFAEVAAPPFAMEASWTADEMLAYLDTWSATQRRRAAHGDDPVGEVASAMRAAWGEPGSRRTVRWPLALRVGRT